jgi:hypothetical protein
MPHWRGDHSYAFICNTEEKGDALNFNGNIPKPWAAKKEIVIGKEDLEESKREKWAELVRIRKLKRNISLVQTVDGLINGRRLQGTPKTSVEGSIVDPELQGNPITEFMEREDGSINGRRMQGTPKTSVEGSIVDPELQGNPITEFMEREDGSINGRRMQGTPKTSVEGSIVNPGSSLEMKKLVSRSSDSDAPPWLNRGANVEPERTQRVTRSQAREQTELNLGEGKCEVVNDIGELTTPHTAP